MLPMPILPIVPTIPDGGMYWQHWQYWHCQHIGSGGGCDRSTVSTFVAAEADPDAEAAPQPQLAEAVSGLSIS